MRLVFFSTFLFMVSCTTVEFVRKDIIPQKQGILRYSPTSSAETETKYKSEVTKKAQQFCGTDFTITKEYQALSESKSSTGFGTGIGFGSGGGASSSIMVGTSAPSQSMYNYVEFTCK